MQLGRYLIIGILMLTLLGLTACGTSSQTTGDSDSSGEVLSTSEMSSTSAVNSGSDDNEAIAADDQPIAGENGATILAQSNNAITDSEKQKILNELNTEIDSLINSINALDDVSDSDLTFEQ
jgi:hypothetical protein